MTIATIPITTPLILQAGYDPVWFGMTKSRPLNKATLEADNCNTGKQPCTLGKLANITIVPVKPAEAEQHKKLVEGAVLAGWAKRCGAECAREWNGTVGKTLGLQAPSN